MKNTVVYIHGKGGFAEEAEHYKPLFTSCKVIGLSYKSNTPMEAKKEFLNFFTEQRKGCDSLKIIANSIGAFFAMSSLNKTIIDSAWFISPIVDMEKLICNMMTAANVTEEELKEKSEIATDFGEVLSWDYLCYVRNNPIKWNVPTQILYGDRDNLTDINTVSNFAKQIGAGLTIMNGGEHWFHTDRQMRFLDNWIKSGLKQK